ncbi:WGR domain-containing protein [Pedobacter frigidisoli]|uniref:WGR domain-containing protein n=1 Tax=Pedobacter frigidisoli TaxID=2530455 RepID=A0A4R0P6L2_9SPHI|nr:AAA domain-containing protein [Pedobacter frigidisoli]TCD11118.1 WGR domain-containing protein [Pedobacter frigidisoli]
MPLDRTTFKTFLDTAFDRGQYATDDIIAFALPLFEEVLSFHEINEVAPFHKENALFITNNRLDIDENLTLKPSYNAAKIVDLFKSVYSTQFDIVHRETLEADVDQGTYNTESMHIHFDQHKDLEHPSYILGYNCFEILINHHDAQTDIFCLGLVLGSLALSLNLYDKDDVKTFTKYRQNPVQYNSRIHPTISALIKEMTELDRAKRSQDLYDVIHKLKFYRDYDIEKQIDLSNVAGWVNKELKERSQFILNKLRNRLFDTSRRNRLLFYKPNMRFVNLTVSSVPMVLHYQSIRPDLLFTWNSDISGKVKGMKEIVLNKYLRFEDHSYLPSALDKIRVESQRDIQEYGFSQLKLVITFLNWHNLKENASERIQSPLLMIPVELKKSKKLKEDHYTMQVLDNAAEVNPVLANQLRELYGIKLPDFVDLDEMSIEQFYQILKSQIDSANQGIQLQYIEKPLIKLIHSVAKQTVGNYKKRLRKSSGLESYKNIGYSYQTEHFKPLGLEIFKQRVESKPSFLEFLINDDIKLASQQLTGNNDNGRELFELTENASNPYSWDFDTCNMVLGNFNYKKMSLVRDYNHVIDNTVQHEVFESLFSNQPRQIKEHHIDLNKIDDWNHVITADPTQTKAILQSRNGDSYIIQGPPGTGKSQTITNLIADFLAQGKNILFVCEKRAALDVVFHRLKQNGLDELCCYIHDSQGDKREFIKNLKATYEDFIHHKKDLPLIKQTRIELINDLNLHLAVLQQFHEHHNEIPETAGLPLRELIDRVIELKNQILPLQPKQEELLPAYKEWISFGEMIVELSKQLEEIGAEPAFADHPLSKLNDQVYNQENPLNYLENLIKDLQLSLNEIDSFIHQNDISPEHCTYLTQMLAVSEDALLLYPFVEYNNIELLDPSTEKACNFDREVNQYQQQKQNLQHATAQNQNWIQKLSRQDLTSALELAENNEGSFLSFLNGGWRNLKKQLQQSYNFSQHQIKPSFTSILQQLKNEYDAQNNLSNTQNLLQQNYHLAGIDDAILNIKTIRQKRGDQEIDYLIAHPNAADLIKKLNKLYPSLNILSAKLNECLAESENKSFDELRDELESILMNSESLLDLLPALKDYSKASENVKNLLNRVAITPAETEASMASKTLKQFYQYNKVFAATDIQAIEKAVNQIQSGYKKLLKLNAEQIRASIRHRFLEHIELGNMALSQLNPQQKAFKKDYNEGRKILENEFSKSMRYKSIRELSAKESCLVLKDIKPVWLMSPLSVSDSLPLDINYFDVVIFDEASQITLEEGIPALYRSPQTIIVGDDKQMPPTNFFSAKAEDPDDLEAYEDDEDSELLSTDADSLLVQGSRKLDSTMLSWHYRSHYETLISYSNHAFYEAGLLTIPDKTVHHQEKAVLEVTQAEDASKYADALFDRSISFHFHPNSVYEKRNNQDEANYIANLVRELLKRGVEESIGIVAFSQEQQHTIENALTSLAATDKEFELLLEEAYNRTQDEQFVGLIIKNLENIQGDERDIIIMSVCYGYDARKKILMNFGPVNKKGGEKRLNVIFSRAKKHMAVISSIKYHNITNEYNEGANYFRRFLQYAESVSTGNMEMARAILDSLVFNKKEIAVSKSSVVLKQIKDELLAKGFEVKENVGQSTFKCSLAVKLHPNDDAYILSILIDDEAHYGNQNLLEQYYQRPAILKSFGWRTMHLYAKDWLQNPQKMMELILKRINEKPVDQIEENLELPTFDKISPVENPNQEEENSPKAAPKSEPIIGYEQLIFDRLVYSDMGSNKFWESATEESKLIIRFGRIGTKGQVNIKTFSSPEIAQKEREKLVKEKLGKGYKIQNNID